jgi:hypothetical protein
MASKYMEKCSVSLVIKEIQIKTTPRFHPTPVRMAIIKVINNNKYCENGMQIATTTIESSMEIPQKTRGRTTI